MSKSYTLILRSVIANTFLLGSFDLSLFQKLHCDENSSMFIYLLVYKVNADWTNVLGKTNKNQK